MIRKLIASAAFGALLLLPTAVAAAPNTPEWQALVKAAKAEGKVEVILSGQVPQRLRPAFAEFENLYGVRVTFQTGAGSAHADRIHIPDPGLQRVY